MGQPIQDSKQIIEAENSVQHSRRWFTPILYNILLVIIGAALFVSAYLLSFSMLTKCFKDVTAIPAWIPIVIIAFDIVWVVLSRFCPVRQPARTILKLVVISVSAGILFAVLCLWGLPA